MALDVYVMPIWRFKVGDVDTPIEEGLDLEPITITVDGASRPSDRRPGPEGSWPHRTAAKWEVQAIRSAVEAANRVEARWNDDGPVVYSRQSLGFEGLRAYARWLDCRDRFPTFDEPPENDYYRHPLMKERIPTPTCPHLVGHSCFSGYYLPVDFENIIEVEPYLILGYHRTHKHVGSSVRLLRELDIVQSELQTPAGYLREANDPLWFVKLGYQQLREVAELSCQHGLPIVFHG